MSQGLSRASSVGKGMPQHLHGLRGSLFPDTPGNLALGAPLWPTSHVWQAGAVAVPTVEEREILTWDLFGTATRELALEIHQDGFRPDLVLGIARGGLFLAGGLGYALDVKNLHVMNVEFYTGVDERLDM